MFSFKQNLFSPPSSVLLHLQPPLLLLQVIAADGEQKAARALKEASDVIAVSPAALQLRYLQVGHRSRLTEKTRPPILDTRISGCPFVYTSVCDA